MSFSKKNHEHHQINKYFLSKKLPLILSMLFLLTGIFGFAQLTPEQKKQQEEAQKKAVEYQKKVMEMMESQPGMKDFMKQIQAAEAQREVDNKKKNTAAEKKRIADSKKHMEEFYWRNKVASNTNGKFKDWKWGAVEIGYNNEESRRNSRAKKYIILGRISNDGLVTMSLPETVKRNRIISNGLLPQMHELTNDEITFSNPNTPYLYYGFVLQVIKEDKSIGYITIGNSERATHNLTVPHMQKYGDVGYLLYWAYHSNCRYISKWNFS